MGTTCFPVIWCEGLRKGDSNKAIKTGKVAVIGSYARIRKGDGRWVNQWDRGR
jgi:hypothetical protein